MVRRYQSYIICTSPRSGSTLLCKLLSATGQSGHPDSHFHSPSLSDWMRYYGVSSEHFANEHDLLTAIFQAAHQRGTGNTGIFGLRLQAQSFSFFQQKLQLLCPDESNDVERIRALFGPTLFIHLTRRDKLDQAISYIKASQTGLWHTAPDGSELERQSAPQQPVYDADAIAQKMAEMNAMDKRWDDWFTEQQLEPSSIQYDDLSANPIAALLDILDQLGLDNDIARNLALPVARMADATNSHWAKRFRDANT